MMSIVSIVVPNDPTVVSRINPVIDVGKVVTGHKPCPGIHPHLTTQLTVASLFRDVMRLIGYLISAMMQYVMADANSSTYYAARKGVDELSMLTTRMAMYLTRRYTSSRETDFYA